MNIYQFRGLRNPDFTYVLLRLDIEVIIIYSNISLDLLLPATIYILFCVCVCVCVECATEYDSTAVSFRCSHISFLVYSTYDHFSMKDYG